MYTGKEGVIGRVGRSILVGQGAIEFLCFDLYRSTSTGRAEHWPHSIREIAVVVVAVVAVVVVVTRIVAVVGPCWGRNLQKHHVEKRFAYHPVETRLLLCPSGGPRRKRKTTGQEENGRRRQEENGRRQAKKRTGHESLVRCRCGQCTGDGPQAQNTEQ